MTFIIKHLKREEFEKVKNVNFLDILNRKF